MPVGFVSLFISQHFSVLMCYHDNMITHKTDFVNPHSYIGEISSFVTKSFWVSINYLILANYSKVQFYKNSTNSLTLSHLGHSNSFASVQPWSFVVGASCTDFVRPLVSIHTYSFVCPYFGILAENPFPVKGCVCLVGFASCKAL